MMITNLNQTSDYTEKIQRCQDYIHALEEERRKIQVFQRELPLCLELVTQAIEACKQQLTNSGSEYNFHGQSECSEQTSSEELPVLEEFIPIKRPSPSDEDEDEDNEKQCRKGKKSNESSGEIEESKKSDENKAGKKSDWLRSVQLWNQTSDPPTKEGVPKEVQVVEVKRNGSANGAFQPFKREKVVGSSSTSTEHEKSGDGRSVAETGGSSGGGGGGGSNKKEEKEGQNQRKQRRCWSPELHRRFLQALQQLGGSHVATPKQIRELMKVDGLTNDEVKSHLQKYRLHTRRPSPSVNQNNAGSPQAPQFVVVGGIWVPPAEYAAMAATPNVSGDTSRTPTGIYAPLAAPPAQRTNQHKQSNSSDRGSSHNSPATSSSDTTTASPPTASR